jgi:hypothetical protein
MTIALIQLSDIHINNFRNEALDRASNIRSAVRSCIESPELVVLLYTGDIAFSGKQEQYHLANEFCSELKALFENDGIATSEHFIPGNHDLDFGPSEDELRDMANAKAKQDVGSLSITGTLTQRLLDQQNAFFAFVAARKGAPLDSQQRLFRKERIRYEHLTIDVNLFNTAFTSTLDEQPGSLVFPDQVVPGDILTDGDLVISLLHHPLHWLEPANSRKLRKFVESGCDLIFTGHEHLPDAFVKLKTKEEQNGYIEGSALHNPPSKSAFNVVEVSFIERRFSVTTCTWNGTLYSPGSPRDLPLVRHLYSSGSKFRTTDEFAKCLEDPGTFYTHSHKKDLLLSDFFVLPTLRKDKSEDGIRAFVEGADCFKFLRESTKITIVGEESSGKTALAKMLYKHYLSDTSYVPLFLNAGDFENLGPKNVRAVIRKAFVQQYGDTRIDNFAQLEPSAKVLIIDDWQEVHFNAKGQARLMQHFKSLFGRIACFTTEWLPIEQMTEPEEHEQALADFDRCSLPEFGVRLRGKLIEQWHLIGQEFTISDDDLAYLVKQSENRINAILEKNFLPSFPFVVLTLLQADDSQTGNANLGSYGHLYEVLITRRLGESSDKMTDLGMKYTYISRLAYFIFSTDRYRVSVDEIRQLHESYCSEYGQSVDLPKMLHELEEAQIISIDADSVRFRYRACYCYFVAKYFQENLASEGEVLRQQLRDIADRVYFEDYANIVVFFVFLTKDPLIIDQIVGNADKIYSELTPFNFTSDVSFMNNLLKETPKRLMESSDPQQNRDKFRQQQDDDEQEDAKGHQSDEPQTREQKLAYSEGLADVEKVSFAFRNQRILGHILRNFTGVLKKEPKKQLAHASYKLALRVMKRVMLAIEQNLEPFRAQLAEVIKQRRAAEAKDEYDLVSDDELKRAADEDLIGFARAVGFCIIKRLSMNLGSEDLAVTYQEVRKESGESDAAVRLIDAALKLDHFRNAPIADIESLAAMFAKNPYSFTVLQDLVAEYLYLNVSDQRELQRIGSLVKIDVSGRPVFLLHKRKALPAKST